MLLSPALSLLVRLKLRGSLRKQLRRLRTPKGVMFAVLGGAIVLMWFASLIFGTMGGYFDPEELPLYVNVGAFAFLAMTITASFNHRGVYMPIEELERLLASPATRRDVLRYRLICSAGRYLFSGLVFGVITARRLPHPLAFFGVLVCMLTLPLVGQLASLTFGALENRLGGWFKRRSLRYLHLLLLGILLILVMAFLFGDEFVAQFASLREIERSFSHLLASDAARITTLPLRPWTSMLLATGPAEFFPWFAFCVAFWFALFELVARFPADFRELSLETSADIARRIRRVQRGGFGASAGKATMRSFGKRVPWLFGRGPFGAMAWIKLASILRKTRGTLTVSILIITLLTVASILLFDGGGIDDTIQGALLLALFGTIYLCAGLRFDFRSDLDRMEAIKSWPISAPRAFLANLLPEVVLVSFMLAVAMVLRIVVTGGFHPALLAVFAGIPLVALAWVSLDNAVFLFAPVRNVAGQEGMLQHMGRSMVLVFLRLFLAASVGGVSAGLGIGVWVLAEGLDRSLRVALVALTVCAILVLVNWGLVWVGGVALRRFDVSRIPR